MRNTQEKFTEALREAAENAGFELVENRQWGNTGTYRIEKPDSFVPALVMSYGFYDGYASFDNVQPPIGDRAHLGGEKFPYVLPEELGTRVLAAVKSHLARS